MCSELSKLHYEAKFYNFLTFTLINLLVLVQTIHCVNAVSRKCEYGVLEITSDTKVLLSHESQTSDLTKDFCFTRDFQNPILTFPTHSIFTVNLASKFKFTRINITISSFTQTLTNEEVMYKFRTYHQYPHNLPCTFRPVMHLHRCWKLTMNYRQSTKSTQYNNIQLLDGYK